MMGICLPLIFSLAEERRSLKAIHHRHFHIHEDHVAACRVLLQQVNSFPAGGHGDDRVFVFLEQPRHQFPVDRVIFHHQDAQLAAPFPNRVAGHSGLGARRSARAGRAPAASPPGNSVRRIGFTRYAETPNSLQREASPRSPTEVNTMIALSAKVGSSLASRVP